MTTPPSEFSLIVTAVSHVLNVEVAGDLDHETSEQLVRTVTEHLTPGAPFRQLRLDFRRLTWIDSMGLSALLAVHRHARVAGVGLRLDGRPVFLDRLLHLTGTLPFLTATTTVLRAGGRDRTADAG
ncbi:STAS domain-containing protein [Streptomyces sp. CRN 30]|uniref:STAS domain-containing protein n=1 Tax=Streptomyces sp. CRN 30 TaxID=3075613 RepID=UPI002A8323DF|nr:STAS domain-containing protein [Streptomyces sp. CRN 30]